MNIALQQIQQMKRGRKQKGIVPGEPEAKKKAVVISTTGKMRPLDSYYYGTIKGDEHILEVQKEVELNMKVKYYCDEIQVKMYKGRLVSKFPRHLTAEWVGVVW